MIVRGPPKAAEPLKASCGLATSTRRLALQSDCPRATRRGASAALHQWPSSPSASAGAPQTLATRPSRAAHGRQRRLDTIPRGIGATVEAGVAAWSDLPLVVQGSVRLVTLTVLALYAADAIVKFMNVAAEKARQGAYSAVDTGSTGGRATPAAKGRAVLLTVVEAALQAAEKPLVLLLPTAASLFAIKELSGLLDLAVHVHKANLGRTLSWVISTGARGLDLVQKLAGDSTELIMVVVVFWFLIDFKDRLVEMLIDLEQTSEKLDRMLRPLNTLATWLLGIAGMLNVLHVFGYNVQPLLAAGGVSGIALGFGAQKITQNLLSGITMFLTQPFVVGERVTLMSGGSKVVTGKVESIDPLNTVIRDDDGVPITIPNTNVQGYHVANESRKLKAAEAPRPSAA